MTDYIRNEDGTIKTKRITVDELAAQGHDMSEFPDEDLIHFTCVDEDGEEMTFMLVESEFDGFTGQVTPQLEVCDTTDEVLTMLSGPPQHH